MFTDIRLETKRLIIRPYTADDIEAFYHIVSQKEVSRYMPPMKVEYEHLKERLLWQIETYKQNTPEKIIRYSVGVEEKSTGQLVGWVGLGPLDIRPEEIEIYYGFGKEFWGKGYASEAAAAFLRYGFETIGLERIVAIVLPANKASIRVIEKIGLPFVEIVTGLKPELSFFEGVHYFALDRTDYRSSESV
ncbi:MAG: GNAT family N-acetyltransferase [Candidatus Zixiibacteriota bacterium]